MINAAVQLSSDKPLAAISNPFGPAVGHCVCTPVRTALAEVTREIEGKCPIVIVAGKPGTGKTLLADKIAGACLDMGLSARQIDHGDITGANPATRADVLLADEADSLPATAIHRLTSSPATALQPHACFCAVRRLSDASMVPIPGLSRSMVYPSAMPGLISWNRQTTSVARICFLPTPWTSLVIEQGARSVRCD
jgi:hypothetical protein